MPETPVFSTAAVAAPHHLAAQSGRDVLAQGGNAVEAMVAMAATIAVVYPHMNGIGGDGFWLVAEPNGRVRAFEACGPAGEHATIARYREKGYDALPPRGPDAAITVAGAVGGWRLACDYARSIGGALPLAVLLGDALRYARDGYPVSRSEAHYAPKEIEALKAAPGFAEFFLVDGKSPPEGLSRRAPRVADVLSHLINAGLDDFYRGDVAREIAADLAEIGAPVTRADLARFEARVVEPLSVRYRDATVYNLPPPTQGLASLVILGLYERLKVARADSLEHHHALIEASKRALRIRDEVVTDPAHLTADPASFLAPAALEAQAARIRMDRAAPFPLPPGDGDTIWMGAIDAQGVAVSYIQSIYWEFGSGCVLRRTGLHWQNRGVSFALDERARNPLRPGRKPFHTLNPALARFDDGRVAPYGSMGGDGQPQFQAQVLTRYMGGQGVADAVDGPRWLLGRTWGSASTSLKVEDRFDPSLLERLSRMGHEIEEMGAPYLDALGHAGLLVKHPRNGHVEASHDPRSDGGAMGL
ncbi:gamma-glutamyltransferase family protein [Salinarimonas soli]|uniref:Gamma-glutamyltransferase n=1 Tax=Salinarimonas soli TaxID=1638099 RepID=A0A5B2VC34_9HYPH|nr:gamma-glutamyltransferase [Salinarimonas soli]KAA2236681.1 gamma-glutamyltransferase [Salinarimonas soli]